MRPKGLTTGARTFGQHPPKVRGLSRQPGEICTVLVRWPCLKIAGCYYQ